MFTEPAGAGGGEEKKTSRFRTAVARKGKTISERWENTLLSQEM